MAKGAKKTAAKPKKVKQATATAEEVKVEEVELTPEMEEVMQNAEEIEVEMTPEFLAENPAVAALQEELPEEVTEEPKVEKPKAVKAKKIQRVLFAVDSFELDAKIKEASQDPMQIVTVLVKDRYSNANVNKYLKSGDLRVITTFAAQFQDEDFDVAYVEKAMVGFIPENILAKLK